jgi:hypothetical protein
VRGLHVSPFFLPYRLFAQGVLMKLFKNYAILALLSISLIAPLQIYAVETNIIDHNIITSTPTVWYKKPIVKYSIMITIGLIIVYASFYYYNDMALIKLMEPKKSKKTSKKQLDPNLVNSTVGSNSIRNCIVTGAVTQDGVITKTAGKVIPKKNNAPVLSTKVDAF